MQLWIGLISPHVTRTMAVQLSLISAGRKPTTCSHLLWSCRYLHLYFIPGLAFFYMFQNFCFRRCQRAGKKGKKCFKTKVKGGFSMALFVTSNRMACVCGTSTWSVQSVPLWLPAWYLGENWDLGGRLSFQNLEFLHSEILGLNIDAYWQKKIVFAFVFDQCEQPNISCAIWVKLWGVPGSRWGKRGGGHQFPKCLQAVRMNESSVQQ